MFVDVGVSDGFCGFVVYGGTRIGVNKSSVFFKMQIEPRTSGFSGLRTTPGSSRLSWNGSRTFCWLLTRTHFPLFSTGGFYVKVLDKCLICWNISSFAEVERSQNEHKQHKIERFHVGLERPPFCWACVCFSCLTNFFKFGFSCQRKACWSRMSPNPPL